MLGASLVPLVASQILVPGACMHLLVLLACVESSRVEADREHAPSVPLISEAQAAGPMGPSLEMVPPGVQATSPSSPECAWMSFQTPRSQEYFILNVSPETGGTFAVLPAYCRDQVVVQRSPSTEPMGYNPSGVPVLPGQVARIYGCSQGVWRYLGEMDLAWTEEVDVREVVTIKEHAANFQCTPQGRNVPFPARVTVHRPK